MELTRLQKLLIRGLKTFKMSEENIANIVPFLNTEAKQIAMMDYMDANWKATEEDLMEEAFRLVKE